MRESGPDSGPSLAHSTSFRFSYYCENDVVSELKQNEEEDGDSEIEFEFAIPGVGEYPSPISADEIFQNGQIKPVFNTNSNSAEVRPIRLPLKKLMISESGDLEGVAPETYCVWTPSNKKSQSSGSSKRWKFRDLLYRSHSEEKKATAKKKATYLAEWFANMNGLSKTVQPF